jgi:thiamine phosphate synthase YjbQ (UPF0047 family)
VVDQGATYGRNGLYRQGYECGMPQGGRWSLQMRCTLRPVFSSTTNEYGLHQDYERGLEELASHAPASQYQHNRTGEDACPERSDRNADALLQCQVIGHEVVVAVTNGRLDFGTWDRAAFSACQRRSLRLSFWTFTDRWC